jgi:Carboxypeptidase regulatory-like domain
MSSPLASPRSLALLAAVVLVGLSAWVLLGSDWNQAKTEMDSGSTPDAESNHPDLATIDPKDLLRPDPIEALDSPLVQADLAVLLSAPRWVSFPEAVKIEILPQGTNPAEKRHLWTKSGGKSVHFLDIGFGSWLVRVQANGFQTVEVPLAVSAQHPHPRQAIPLLPSRSITGRVQDADGHAVAHLQVSARLQTPLPGFTVTRATTKTDDEGRYTISGLPEGSYFVFPGELRSPIGEMVPTELVGEQGYADLTVPVLSQAIIVVKDDSTGQLLPDMRVQAMRTSTDGMPGHTAFRQSDPQGAAHFDHLPSGEYIFTVFGTGYVSKTQHVMVEIDASGTVEIAVKPLERNS